MQNVLGLSWLETQELMRTIYGNHSFATERPVLFQQCEIRFRRAKKSLMLTGTAVAQQLPG
jgi:hypothetical protein